MAQSGTVISGVSIDASGKRLGDMSAVQDAIANNKGRNAQHGITAATTQTQAGAAATAQLNYGVNNVLVCANNNDSVGMPAAIPGAVVYVSNAGAQTFKVFGKLGTTDTLNGTAGATGITGAPTTKLMIAMCSVAGVWRIGFTA